MFTSEGNFSCFLKKSWIDCLNFFNIASAESFSIVADSADPFRKFSERLSSKIKKIMMVEFSRNQVINAIILCLNISVVIM